jgi:hypothetical protein
VITLCRLEESQMGFVRVDWFNTIDVEDKLLCWSSVLREQHAASQAVDPLKLARVVE